MKLTLNQVKVSKKIVIDSQTGEVYHVPGDNDHYQIETLSNHYDLKVISQSNDSIYIQLVNYRLIP